MDPAASVHDRRRESGATLGQVLASGRGRRFVGRAAEVELSARWWTPRVPRSPCCTCTGRAGSARPACSRCSPGWRGRRALFATGSRSHLIHGEAHAAVDEAFGDTSPWFTTRIRHAERTAQDARRLGKLAHELEVEAEAQPAWYEALQFDHREPRISPTAASVAGDHRALGMEVLSALQTAEEAERGTGRRGAP